MERLQYTILLMLGLISVCHTLPGSNNVYYHNDDNKSSLPNNNPNEDTQSVNDKVNLLTKQLGALSLRRRDDYKMLEISLQKYVRKNSLQLLDIDIKKELNDLREEVKTLREGVSTNKERLTMQWLSQSITEIRSEIAEIQESSSNLSKNFQKKNLISEDIESLRSDLQNLRLELTAIKSRQDNTDVFVRELREEAIQSSEDLRRSLLNHNKDLPQTIDYIEPEADHRLRHHRMLRQEVHDLQIEQQSLKRNLNELQNHRLGDRIRSLEIEQRRLASSNFNLSRQVANLDKLHSSMLELLEDIEGLQNKVDKTIPDIKREISKMEFTSAQTASEQNFLKEESRNIVKNIQALSVSMSSLQDDRLNTKAIELELKSLQNDIEVIRSAAAIHKEIAHSQINKIESEAKQLPAGSHEELTEMDLTSRLVGDLENMELEYENIINKLPHDCSQIMSSKTFNPHNHNSDGVYLIAPSGQHHPVLTKCRDKWTSIQKRINGVVDFNRSWDEYAKGFGTPNGEFYIGNEMLHHLTSDNCTKLRIEMQDIYDKTWYAEYEDFRIGSRQDGYRLDIGGYRGNASNAMNYQNKMQFSSIDVDRDISNTHCAGNYEGGWWFSHCQHANLNGRYNLGLTWFNSDLNEWVAVKSSHMLVSKRDECTSDEQLANNYISDINNYESTAAAEVFSKNSQILSTATSFEN